MPEAERADNAVAVARHEPQPVGGKTSLAQPFGRLRETVRSHGAVEEGLTGGEVVMPFDVEIDHRRFLRPSWSGQGQAKSDVRCRLPGPPVAGRRLLLVRCEPQIT